VNNPSNWTTNEDFLVAGYDQWPDWNFNIGIAEPSVVNFAVSAVSITEGGNPVNVNFSINPLHQSPYSEW
jgi:transketolase C-terminal domain/subunit